MTRATEPTTTEQHADLVGRVVAFRPINHRNRVTVQVRGVLSINGNLLSINGYRARVEGPSTILSGRLHAYPVPAGVEIEVVR